ncbi:OmpA family protein [Rubritepida flocculans]|jgi:flagellar motor protein MotB|uniref:hypothetical protein n=1 Tax=Rubritepida flocculans TaxID=182403 RepID=UPI00041EBB61|nr:hypothetical protein [Rubritepida flocculans]
MRPARRALLLLPLAGPAARAQPRAALPEPVPAPGVVALPGGGWRLLFAREEERPSPEQRLTLMEIGNILAAYTQGRVTLWAEVALGEDVSEARRLSLRRALAVREALVLGGLPETRVDLRPLGRTEARQDVVDILPPGAARP